MKKRENFLHQNVLCLVHTPGVTNYNFLFQSFGIFIDSISLGKMQLHLLKKKNLKIYLYDKIHNKSMNENVNNKTNII